MAPKDVFEEFALAANHEGQLSRESFDECFYGLMERSGHLNNSTDADRAENIVETLFDGFDRDGTGFVDFAEITTGVSILCGGTADDRTLAAFQLYDVNGDGFITFPEFQNYLSAVFRIMYTLVPNTIHDVGVPSEVLAATTARAAFEEFDINMDGRLSYEEFRSWHEASYDTFILGLMVNSTTTKRGFMPHRT